MTGSAIHISKPLDAADANNRETHVSTSRLVLFDFWLVTKIVGDFSVHHKELQNKTTIIRIWLFVSELKLSWGANLRKSLGLFTDTEEFPGGLTKKHKSKVHWSPRYEQQSHLRAGWKKYHTGFFMIRPIRKSYTCRQKNTRLGSVRGWGTEPGFVLSPGGTGERGASLNSRNNLLRARNLETKEQGLG